MAVTNSTAPDKPAPEKYVVGVSGRPFKTSNDQLYEQATETGSQATSKQSAEALAQAYGNLDYVDQNWGTAGKLGMGALSGLSLGLAPGILAQSGLVDPGHISAAETSGWYTAGDLAGMVLPSLASGGEATGLRAALKYSPAGLMEMAGSGAERLVGGVLGDSLGVMGKAAMVPVKMAARGATEGALVSMGHQIGQDLIQNNPLSAQATLAAAQDGALMGSLIGGGLGTLGSIGKLAIEEAGALAKSVASKGNLAEGTIAKRLNTSAEDLAGYKSTEGGYKNHLKDVNEALDSSGTGANLGSSDPELRKAFSKAQTVQKAVREDVINTLDQQAASETGNVVSRIRNRADEVLQPFMNTAKRDMASSVVADFQKDLESIHKTGLRDAPIRDFRGDITGMGKEAFKNPPTWKELVTYRDMVSKELSGIEASENPLLADKLQLKKALLNAMDSELRQGMEGAALTNPELAGLAEKYRGATHLASVSEKLEQQIGKREAQKLLSTEPTLTPRDIASAGGMTALGHPGAALGWLAAKGIGRALQRRLEPAIAQMAFEASIGTKAASATGMVQTRIRNGVKSFFSAATSTPRKAAYQYGVKTREKDYGANTRQTYEDAATRTEQLLSETHQERVRKYTEALTAQGYGDYAKSLLETNQRATQYLLWNTPPRSSTKGLNSLRPMPLGKGLTMQEYKHSRLMKGVTDPMSLIDDLENGNVSRDAVKAMKYVYPDLHAEIASAAAQEIFEMKQEGKFLPMGKIVNLGIALDTPIDSTLTPQFVSGVQAALTEMPSQPPEGAPSGPQGPSQGIMTPTERMMT